MNQSRDDFSEIPATSEPRQPAEETKGAQETAQSLKPNGGTTEPAQPTTQPAAKPNGSAGSTETQNTGIANNGKPGEPAPPTIAKPNGNDPEAAQPNAPPPAKPNGSAGSTEPQSNPGGSIFDPARWKTPVDARLDPKAPVKPAAFSKIEVKKPPRDDYVHAHPDPALNGVFPLYADSAAKRYDPYLIAPELLDSLPPQVRVNIQSVRLAVAITDRGRLFLWYSAQTGSEWHESGDNAILTTMTEWRKVISDGNGYRLEPPLANLEPPVFPAWTFEEYLSRAFKERYIDSLEHPVIKRLAGIR